MTITISYPSGFTRVHKDMTQRQVNRLITLIDGLNQEDPIDFVRIVVEP